ncbi:MAG: hypothetical protein ACJAVI_005021 [Candidatus Azotimanducaceae bacterium]
MKTERSTALLSDSFSLLRSLFDGDDETEKLQLAEIAIEIDSVKAIEARAGVNPAISKQLEIKLLQVERLITRRVVERLAYYVIPEENTGTNEKALLAPGISELVKKHYGMADLLDEDFQLRNQLAKILSIVDLDVDSDVDLDADLDLDADTEH